MQANIQSATVGEDQSKNAEALLALIQLGSYVDEQTSLDADGDVYLVKTAFGRWFVGATFTDGAETIFVDLAPAETLTEEAAKERFYVNSAEYAEDQFGTVEAYAAYVDAEVDRLREERLIGKYAD